MHIIKKIFLFAAKTVLAIILIALLAVIATSILFTSRLNVNQSLTNLFCDFNENWYKHINKVSKTKKIKPL